MENEQGIVNQICGPLVLAQNMAGAKMYEIVRVGWFKLIGEIIRLKGDDAYIQIYEDTSGLSIGDPVIRTGLPLSVELGPGLIENIFDGVQRPLKLIAEKTQSVYIPKGITLAALNRNRDYHWNPYKSIETDSIVSAGDVLGSMYENELFKAHKIMVPPNIKGRVVSVMPSGNYTIQDTLIELEYMNEKISIGASHFWPVREPRPVYEKLAGIDLLKTGQRVLDCLFPSVLGGTCAIPGAFGAGKTCISQALSKYSNTDMVVYVGCGERGNEIAELLAEFPQLKTMINGEEHSIMKRTCLVANTSNMPVAAREASIYTGVTIAEYFRDMGYNVAMMADSTSRWAEALREISGRLAEMPADSGYPAYLSARLANFYERAGKATCLGSPNREGSITIVGAVSPPGGDYSDPVTIATMNIVQVFWGLDKKLAQRKHFPSVNWTKSYSNYVEKLSDYFYALDPEYKSSAECLSDLLQKEVELQDIVQLVGRESLSEDQKLALETAKIIREDFLQQNAFSDYDYTCPINKTIGMAKIISHFYKSALEAITVTSKQSNQISFGLIKNTMNATIKKIIDMKFLSPTYSKTEYENYFNEIIEQINSEIRSVLNN